MLVAEGSDMMRAGFRSVVGESEQTACIDEVSSLPDLLTNVRSHDYELIVIEPVLAGGTGEALIRQLLRIAPRSNILVLTSMDELVFGMRAFQCGAKGYLMKTCTNEELIRAVTRVGRGNIHVSSRLAEAIAIRASSKHGHTAYDALSERELQVFSMLVCGVKVSEIAKLLYISIKTVSTHKVRVMTKLGLATLSDVIQYAISHDLVEDCKARCAARASLFDSAGT
jgi:DNA-binding NarL/FixJ family response regulator